MLPSNSWLLRQRLASWLGAGVLVFGVSGCIDPSVETFPEAQQALKLTGVTVDYRPGAYIHISAVEDEVISHGGASREEVATAERAQISRILPEEFMAVVGPKLKGSRPVVARVHVDGFNIPGPVGSLVNGGTLGLRAGVDLVDGRTGQTVSSIPPDKLSSSVHRPGGVVGFAVAIYEENESTEKKSRAMLRAFAEEYGDWIAPK